MRSKRSKLVTVWKSFPLPVFMGGSIKKFLFPVRYIASPLFRVKKSVYSEKNVFGQSIFGLSYCSILSRPQHLPKFGLISTKLWRLNIYIPFGCRSDCSTVPRQFTKKIFRIMRNEHYTALCLAAV